jgi:hypothetical protein
VARSNRKVLHPQFANRLGSFDQLACGFRAVLNQDDHPGIELPLRFVDGGQAWAFGSDDVLNGDLGTVRLKNGVSIGVFARGDRMAQNEEVGNLRRGDQTHEIEIKV